MYAVDKWLYSSTKHNSLISITHTNRQKRETQKLVSQVEFRKNCWPNFLPFFFQSLSPLRLQTIALFNIVVRRHTTIKQLTIINKSARYETNKHKQTKTFIGRKIVNCFLRFNPRILTKTHHL